MKNNRTNDLADVRNAIAQGFATKQAKKDAAHGLEVELGLLNSAAKDKGANYWDLPHYPHEVGKKALALFDGLGLGDQARELVAVRLELKAAEVVKAAPKVDDTKMRDLSPREATTAGIDYIDMNGDRRGYCYCCGRVGFKLNAQGRLSRHGYQRPGWGYDLGGCDGSRMTPEQTLEAAIEWHGRMIADLEALLATDLFAFSIKQGRKLLRSQRLERTRFADQRGSYGRDRKARAFRNLRAGKDDSSSISGPSVWRRMLTQQLEQHQAQLAALEEVKAGI